MRKKQWESEPLSAKFTILGPDYFLGGTFFCDLVLGTFPGGTPGAILVPFEMDMGAIVVPFEVVTLMRCKFGLNLRRVIPVILVPTPPRYLGLPRVVTEFPTWVRFPQYWHTRAITIPLFFFYGTFYRKLP